MKCSRFILAVDSYLVRKGLVTLLNRIPGSVVLREFEDAETFSRFMKERQGDFLLISESIFNHSTSLFLSREELLEKTLLISDNRMQTENREVHSVIHASDSRKHITDKILEMVGSNPERASGTQPAELTRREKTIVRLVSMGFTNKQIADQLFLSAHTVMTHRKNINNKLGIKSVSGLTVYAIVNNLITIEEVTSKPEG